MKKMRISSLEFFLEFYPIEEVVKMGFDFIDKEYPKIEDLTGKKIEKPEILILNHKEYKRPVK